VSSILPCSTLHSHPPDSSYLGMTNAVKGKGATKRDIEFDPAWCGMNTFVIICRPLEFDCLAVTLCTNVIALLRKSHLPSFDRDHHRASRPPCHSEARGAWVLQLMNVCAYKPATLKPPIRVIHLYSQHSQAASPGFLLPRNDKCSGRKGATKGDIEFDPACYGRNTFVIICRPLEFDCLAVTLCTNVIAPLRTLLPFFRSRPPSRHPLRVTPRHEEPGCCS
jgi:hypothetical protein